MYVIKLSRNIGYAKAYNSALKKIDSDVYCLINNDVMVNKNWTTPIMSAFNNKKVEEIKHLVSAEVYENFQKAIDKSSSSNKIFKIDSVKASILNIYVFKNYANIKVKFLSNQKVSLNNKTKSLENIKDIWTFQKDMTANSFVWELIEVGTD